MSGRLIGVGTGPGDPELLTLKAARALAEADVIAYFAKAGRIGNARAIVAPHLRAGVEELPLYYPVTTFAYQTVCLPFQSFQKIIGKHPMFICIHFQRELASIRCADCYSPFSRKLIQGDRYLNITSSTFPVYRSSTVTRIEERDHPFRFNPLEHIGNIFITERCSV